MEKAQNAELVSLISYVFEDHDRLFEELTPEGWINCSLVYFLHPTPEQRFVEEYKMYERLRQIDQEKGEPINRKPPQRKDFQPEDLTDLNPISEFRYLLALAIYEIFSNNHQVVDMKGKLYDLGSLRGSGRFLAEFLNMYYPGPIKVYDYLDFYCTYSFIEHRSDLSPLFKHVFQKLKSRDINWIYAVPEIFWIDFSGETDQDERSFDPHRDILEGQYNDLVRRRMEHALEDVNKSLKKQVLSQTPVIVSSYVKIYGGFPEGWPEK